MGWDYFEIKSEKFKASMEGFLEKYCLKYMATWWGSKTGSIPWTGLAYMKLFSVIIITLILSKAMYLYSRHPNNSPGAMKVGKENIKIWNNI